MINRGIAQGSHPARSACFDAQVEVSRLLVGTLMSSLDMAGFSLSLLVLDDARIAALDAPTQARVCG